MFRPMFSAELPDGWLVQSGLGYCDPGGTIRVSVHEEQVPAHLSTAQYAQAHAEQTDRLGARYEVVQACAAATLFGTFDGLSRTLRWHGDDGEAYVQQQSYLVIDGRGVLATATAPESFYTGCRDDFDQALQRASLAPLRLVPRTPVGTGAGGEAADFDSGHTSIGDPESGSGVAAFELTCSTDELAALARGRGLSAYPGVPDGLPESASAFSAGALRAARRSLRAGGIVEVGPGGTRLSPAAAPLLEPISSPMMLTLESTDAGGFQKTVWYGVAAGYLEISAVDSGLVRIVSRDREAVLGRIGAAVQGVGHSGGRVAWLTRQGNRLDGAAITWAVDGRGSIVEHGAGAAAAMSTDSFLRRLDDAVGWLD